MSWRDGAGRRIRREWDGVFARDERLLVHEERVGQVAHVGIRRVEMSLPEGKEPLLTVLPW